MRITARLLINGIEKPLAGASFRAPTGGLGGSVSIAPALPDLSLIPEGALIRVEVGVGVGKPTVYSFVPIVDAGKVAGRDYTASWNRDRPGDILDFSALSPLSERWNLAPARPVILYNPDRVDSSNLIGNDAGLVRTEGGLSVIRPVLEPVDGLTLRAVLDRAYTNRSPSLGRAAIELSGLIGRDAYAESLSAGLGAGFSRVVTNLPDFPVDRVDFTPMGGWHAAAASLIGAFEPVVFEDNNVLYIIAPDRGLPVGFIPRSLPLGCTIEVTHTQAAEQIINVLIISYQTRQPQGSGEIRIEGAIPSVERPAPTIRESGSGKGYTRTEEYPEFTVWRSLATGAEVLRQELQIEKRVYAYRDTIKLITQPGGTKLRVRQPGGVRHISSEYITNEYQGKLKVGHTRRVEAVYYNPNQQGAPDTPGVVEVLVETSRIKWRPDLGSPGDSELLETLTETEGVVLVQKDKDGNKTYTPILDAMNSGVIRGDGTQHTDRMPIETRLEELRSAGYNQSAVYTTLTNHLVGSVENPPPVFTRTGSRSTAYQAKTGNRSAATSIQEELTDTDSIALYGRRRAAPLELPEIDPIEARAIGRRRLYRLAHPRKYVTIIIPGIDFSIRRGSVLIPPYRTGYAGAYLVLGYSYVLRGLGTPNIDIRQTIEAVEIG